jgi:hypothetical protein
LSARWSYEIVRKFRGNTSDIKTDISCWAHAAFEPAKKRRWKKCYLVLHGTKLEVHKPKKIPFFSSARKAAADPARPVGYRPGTLLESYTLQLAEVGTATDYRKRHFAIRLRVQTVQFLISCKTLETFLEWLEALSAAIDLSPSLEERSDPRYHTLPRRRRRRVTLAPATAGEVTPTTTVQERFGALRGNLPHDAENPALGRQTSNQESIRGSSDIQEATRTHPHTPPHLRRTRTQPEEEEAPPFDADGKWAPRSPITREANLRFARRCMAILARDAPRQSEFVVVKGKRYRLLYESKKMVPDGSSEPEEPEAPSSSSWWGIRPGTAKGKPPEDRDKPPLPRLPEYEEVVGGAGIAVVVSAW